MSFLVKVAAAVAILIPQFAFGGVIFWPHPDLPAPKYFSGTNSRAFYNAIVAWPDVHIEAAQIWLNDELTIDDTYPIMGSPAHPIYLHSKTLGVMFDSNHLGSGFVTVKMRVKAGGVWYEDSYYAPIENNAGVFGRYEWETDVAKCGGSVVKTKLDGISYPFSYVYDQGWDSDNVSTVMDAGSTNILYFNTHGSLDHFSTDKDEVDLVCPRK